VTAIDLPELAPSNPPSIALNEWAARDLQAKRGDTLYVEKGLAVGQRLASNYRKRTLAFFAAASLGEVIHDAAC
jgi:hypothetical protein